MELEHLETHFLFIIQRVKARAVPCPHRPPNRGHNTVSVAQGGTATPGATKQLFPPDRVIKRIIYICIYLFLWIVLLILDQYLIMLSVKQGGILCHFFFFLVFGLTWLGIKPLVSLIIGESYANKPDMKYLNLYILSRFFLLYSNILNHITAFKLLISSIVTQSHNSLQITPISFMKPHTFIKRSNFQCSHAIKLFRLGLVLRHTRIIK